MHRQITPCTPNIIGDDYQRVGDIKNAVEIFQLNLLAYADSVHMHYILAEAYLAIGQRDLARTGGWACAIP